MILAPATVVLHEFEPERQIVSRWHGASDRREPACAHLHRHFRLRLHIQQPLGMVRSAAVGRDDVEVGMSLELESVTERVTPLCQPRVSKSSFGPTGLR